MRFGLIVLVEVGKEMGEGRLDEAAGDEGEAWGQAPATAGCHGELGRRSSKKVGIFIYGNEEGRGLGLLRPHAREGGTVGPPPFSSKWISQKFKKSQKKKDYDKFVPLFLSNSK